jgi:hypothetical protein
MPTYTEQMELLQAKRRELRALEAQAERTARSLQPLTEADEREMMASQVKADAAYVAAGRMGSPSPMSFERPAEYERRLIEGISSHSKTWARADFSKMPDEAFRIARDQVISEVAAMKPSGLGPHELRKKPAQSQAGHRTIDFIGGDSAWFGRCFERQARRANFLPRERYLQMQHDAQAQVSRRSY